MEPLVKYGATGQGLIEHSIVPHTEPAYKAADVQQWAREVCAYLRTIKKPLRNQVTDEAQRLLDVLKETP